MKKNGYEVVATRPVCVDFSDGRAVSFRPGQRFEADVHNTSVQRLLRVGEVRQLNPREPIAPLPVTLGRPPAEAQIITSRAAVAMQAKIAAAKQEAAAKMVASRSAPPKIEETKPPVHKPKASY